ncbi:MAG: DNA-3-methyladenine glycosylase I [Saprospiraceae bacterium]|jgi:DNA-3-methyladenine glycosylase I|tara:strand:+ start:1406 stop:1981 length:576 start_codon:yes stop_codon:yes gene_type:complete
MQELHKKRCSWPTKDAQYLTYHDQEWGRAVHDDQRLFEQLVLEGAQAGLSWLTILKRRHHYKRVFCQYDVAKLAAFTAFDIANALQDKGIIRNRLKVHSVVNNAAKFIAVQQEFGSFDTYIWGFVDGTTIVNEVAEDADVPAQTELSVRIAKDLKKRGFKFIGPVGMYAYMQAIGMVNDHVTSCFCYPECC